MTEILPFIIQGLVLGGIYALVAVGLSLMFGVLDVINVAHGETLALGGYLMFLLVTYLMLPAWPALALSMIGGFAVGALIYWVLIRSAGSRLAGRSPGVVFLVVTLGLSTFLQNGMQAVFGADYRSVAPFTTSVHDVLGVPVAGSRLLIVGVAALLLVALFGFPSAYAGRARHPRRRAESRGGAIPRDTAGQGVPDHLRDRWHACSGRRRDDGEHL